MADDVEHKFLALVQEEEKSWFEKFEDINSHDTKSFQTMDNLLKEAYTIFQPTESAYKKRKEVVQFFNLVARELFASDVGNCDDYPVVLEFGSSAMGLFTPYSDLDLSINLSPEPARKYPRSEANKILVKLEKKLIELQDGGLVDDVQLIKTAKVPIIKVVHVATKIDCDIAIEGNDGILMSKSINFMSSYEERFKKLCILMKVWAKAHRIYSAREHTLNSTSIVSLVACHLQTRDPPILPPFSAILEGREKLEMENICGELFKNYGTNNTESLGQLFVSFLIKLASAEEVWKEGLCASPYQGRWILKRWTAIASISVEDFTNLNQNIARSVRVKEVGDIYGHIKNTIIQLHLYMNGKINKSVMKEYFFGNVCCANQIEGLNTNGIRNISPETHSSPVNSVGRRHMVQPMPDSGSSTDASESNSLAAATGLHTKRL